MFDRAFTVEHRNAAVFSITVSGSPVDRSDPNSVLHWRLFARLSLPEEQAVVLDLVPGGGADPMVGTLLLTSKEYANSRTAMASKGVSCAQKVHGSRASRSAHQSAPRQVQVRLDRLRMSVVVRRRPR